MAGNGGLYLLTRHAGRCPACGEGRLFRAFVKVADRCNACGEDLHHHRADDFPAYLTIFMVGHRDHAARDVSSRSPTRHPTGCTP